MSFRHLDKPADDRFAETHPLKLGMDSDVGDVCAVEAVGDGPYRSYQRAVRVDEAFEDAVGEDRPQSIRWLLTEWGNPVELGQCISVHIAVIEVPVDIGLVACRCHGHSSMKVRILQVPP